MNRRWSLAVATVLSLVLAGCATPGEAAPDLPAPAASLPAPGAPEVPLLPSPVVLLDHEFVWHVDPEDPGAADPLPILTLFIHPVFPDCITSDEEPYLTNLELAGLAGVPDGTGALEVVLSWPDAVSTFDELVVAYRSDEGEAWTESEYIAEGDPYRIPVNETQWDGDDRRSSWRMVACVSRDPDNYPGTTFRAGLFTGRLHVVVTALPAADL